MASIHHSSMSVPNYHGHRDPREGEWPEPQDQCPHGVDRNEAECGACWHDGQEPIICIHGKDVDTWCLECSVAAEMQLAGAFVKVLDRIRMAEDETLGAALAAREQETQ